jgi:hypothetical protein
MRCRRVRRHLATYRELDESARRDVMSHVGGCPSCASICNSYHEQDHILSSVPAVQPSAKLSLELQRRISRPRSRERSAAVRWVAAAASALVVFGFAGGAVSMASETIPGDFLYSVKRVSEQARWALTVNSTAREEYRQRLVQERLQEVRQVLDMGRKAQVNFQGELQGIATETWTVAGVEVTVDQSNWDQLPPELGSELVIRALAYGGQLRATHVALSRYGPLSPHPGNTPTVSSTPTALSESSATPTTVPTELPTKQSPAAGGTPGKPTSESRQHTSTPQERATPQSTPQSTPVKHASATPTGETGTGATATAGPAGGTAEASPTIEPPSATPDHTPAAGQPTETPQAGDPGPQTQPTPSGPGPVPGSSTPGPGTGPGPSRSATQAAAPAATPAAPAAAIAAGHSGNNH